ncbi:MAG: S41 family peptidase [Pseudomonadota bacterium]
MRVRLLPLLLLVVPTFLAARIGYYQHPTVSGDLVVFESEGDLWRVALDGGAATRLTTHRGRETQPALSPDGASIAFLAEYDGGFEVYLMPVDGGEPRRLTYGGEVVSVEGWTAEGDILYVTSAVANTARSTQVRQLDPASGLTKDWPLLGANQAALTSDGIRVFTRNGLHRTGDHARRYRGGAMATLWAFEPGADEARPLLPDLAANQARPLVAGDRVVFLGDPDGSFNLWSMRVDGSDLRQLSRHDGWDARHADTDGRTVVYQLGAAIHRVSLSGGTTVPLEITLQSDLEPRRVRWLKDPLRHLGSLTVGPEGKRVAASVRGRVALFGLPGERRVELDLPATGRARQAIHGADGEWIYAFASVDGRDQLVRMPATGAAGREVLVAAGPSHGLVLAPSPDGRHIAHTDLDGNLWLYDLENQRNSLVDNWPDGNDSIGGLAWSPDGSRLAYTRPADTTRIDQLFLRDVAAEEVRAVTSDRFPSGSPAFSRDGRFLYFLSARTFDATPGAPWGDRNMGPAFDRREKVYALALDPEARFPFLPAALGAPAVADQPSDDDGEADGSQEEAEAATPPLVWEGLTERLYEVPVPSGNYRSLNAAEKFLLVLDRPLQGDPALKSIAIDEHAKTETFAAKVSAFDLSADGKTVLFRVAQQAFLVDVGAKAPDDRKQQTVDTAGWRLAIDPANEWRQMFDDAWRMHRDFSFDTTMRGLDWDAVRARYAPLVERVTHRRELDDLLGEMIGELGILHSQVGRAEVPNDEERPAAASLGADFEASDDGLRVRRIFSGDPDLLDERSPLARPEVDVRVGDVITAVNHGPVRTEAELYAALLEQADRPVVLQVRRGSEAPRITRTKPIPAGQLPRLRYRAWEQDRRARVDEASEGAIGYLHLYAMGSRDIADFAREFFPQLRRQGLIIDVRGNRGGNVDAWVLNALLRQAWMFWQTADAETASFENMQGAFRGHVAVLIDEFTYSDGETFAAGIKALDLGPLIGKRTAGAGIWLSDRNALADGGIARIAEFAQFAPDGRWLVEGRGVSPDIEVDNPPHAAWRGDDPQLTAAIEYLREQIEENPIEPLRGDPISPVGAPAQDVR